jgi:extracellular elastinolytic metalloproteinase
LTANIADSTPTFDAKDAITVAEDALGGKHNDIEPILEYLARPDGSVALTHVIQVKNDDAKTWYEAFVDAHSGELLSITDFVAHATVRRYLLLSIRRL